jgi:diguanylate cyclase (GGDEF)-like protein/PAS domain S-box-containing protein
VRGYPIKNEDGQITGLVEFCLNITKRKRAEAALKEERALFIGGKTVVFKRRNAVGWPIEYVSPNCPYQFGHHVEELMVDTVDYASLIHPDDLRRVRREILQYAKANALYFEQEYRIRRKDGEYRWVYDFTVPAKDAAGMITHYHGYIVDSTEHKRTEEELIVLATTDKLTGAYNRTKSAEIIKQEMERFRRFGRPLSIIVCDIDKFKKVNDTYGHVEGDNVLKSLSEIVMNNIRSIDFLVRWGGEEFFIICTDTDRENALILANRIKEALAGHVFDKVGTVSVSFGLTQVIAGDVEDSFLKRADDAMYAAKAKGGGGIEVR